MALTGVTAACVLLRLDGRLVASGEAALPTATLTAASANDQGVLLRRAVGRAVAKALSDSTIASVRAAVGDKVTARLSLEVELAGPVRPLAFSPNGQKLFVVNTPDAQLEIYRVDTNGRLTPIGSIAVGLEPVAVARRMRELETAGKIARLGERDGYTVWALA